MKIHVGLLCLMLTIRCLAQGDPLADLKKHADESSGADCVHLSMDVARKSLEEADRQFSNGEIKAAHRAVDDSVRYVRRSVDCSLQVHKSEKSEEIDLRQLIRRTKDVIHTLDSMDRPHLEHSMLEMEKQRDRLLQSIFGTNGGSSPEKKP